MSQFITIVTETSEVVGVEDTQALEVIEIGNGLSAYQIAVLHGFVGTEAEWLASLQGGGGGSETTTTLGALINGATAKATPVDADMLPLMDSAASNIVKKLSWANVKATLKTYFDTLYQPLSAVLTATTAAFTTAQETKLAGIATGATANSSDATLLARANHTGTQAQSTVVNLVTDLAAKAAASHNHAGSEITSGNIPAAQMQVNLKAALEALTQTLNSANTTIDGGSTASPGVTLKVKRKAGAFTNGQLAAGELGLNTSTHEWYWSEDGSTVQNWLTALAVYFALDSAVVHDTGDEDIDGVKTFFQPPIIPDESYDASGWNSKVEPPTKSAVRDVIVQIYAELDAKVDDSQLDTDITLAANSDALVATQKAVKAYVDAMASGLDPKPSVRVATTANISLSGTQTIDGVSVIAGNRVLVKDQSTASQNGIYVCAAGAWSRATDADASAEVTSGMYCYVSEGTTNATSGWVLSTADPITLGSTSLTFTQFSGAGQITAGAALTKTGNVLDVAVDNTTIEVSGDALQVKASVLAAKANDSAVVHNTGNETVAGVKTFSSSPIVPAPTTDLQAATKKYVDDAVTAGGGYTDELAQDAAAALFTPDDGDVDYTYNDATPSITSTIKAAAVSLAKMASVATGTIFYRKTAGTGAPEVQTLATLKTDLGLTGTNSGDQDLSPYFNKSADDTDDITVGATNKFATAAEKTKLGHISVTQAVDLDDIETRVNNLDAAVVLKGTWDASAGTFPGGGTAQAGASYIVSVGGTVDSVVFAVGDRVIAILDNASTTTFASNWFKADYTDQVLSVNGSTGAVTISTITGNAGTATALQNARTIGGVSFDGTANITVSTATGGFTVSGGNLALGTNSITMSGSIGVTGTRVTKGWFTDGEFTNMPTVGGASLNSTFQPLDGDLTTIAGLTATTDNFIVSVASAWASRTPAQVKTTLSLNNVDNTSNATERAATATLTNKRIQPRTGTTTSSTTPTINTDNVDFYSITAQTADITSFTTNLSGTPVENQKLWIAITGTAARGITWGSSFEASTVALPTTTVSTNRLDVGFVWNTVTSKWRCIAAA